MAKTGFVYINSGGTMGHSTIVKTVSDRLKNTLSDECLIVTDEEETPFYSNIFSNHHVVHIPRSTHQLSVGGCVEGVDTRGILLAVKKFGCDRVIFSTFFSTKIVKKMIASTNGVS